MPKLSEQERELVLLVCFMVAFLMMVLVLGPLTLLKTKAPELKRLNRKIAQTTGSKRKHYVRQRRRLLRSLFSVKKRRPKFRKS